MKVDIDNFYPCEGCHFLSYLYDAPVSWILILSMIENVYVTGGIGSGINMKNAVTIGMFPDVEIDKFHYIGNSSLTGAYNMTLSVEAEH